MADRHRGAHDEVTRFVLLSTQRSGTSWVMERLASHPGIGGYGEVLLLSAKGWSDWPRGAADRPFFATYLEERSLAASRLARHAMLRRYLDYLYEPRRGFQAIGFKLMYDQVARLPGVLAYLRSRHVKVLHLVRVNSLDVLLSRQAQEARHLAHARSPEERETVRVRVDTAALLAALRRIDRERRVARAILHGIHAEICELSYEAIVADDQLLCDALQFLGIELASAHTLTASMLKLAPHSHREGIENYDEVVSHLTRTRFASLLHP
jgi:hypothetical protein